MSILTTNPLGFLAASAATPAGYSISRSLRFNSSDSAYLSRTPASAGNRKTWTWAGWVKLGKLGTYRTLFSSGTAIGERTVLLAGNGNTFDALFVIAGVYSRWLISTAVFRDPSAWYHVVYTVDTTQATAANRVKLWVNNVQQSFASGTQPDQNYDTYVNSTNQHLVGNSVGTTDYADFMLADIHFIDGQALDPTSFGEFDSNGIWQPKAYAGTYGTNGFHLDFADNSTTAALGTDSSGQGNTWTVNNITANAGRYAIGKTVPYSPYGTSDPYILFNSATAPLVGTSFPGDSTYLSHAQISAPFNSDIITFSPAITSVGTVYLYALKQSSGGNIKVNVGYPSETTISISTAGWSYHNTGLSTIYNIQFLAATSGSNILSGLQFISTTSDASGRLSSSPPQHQDSLVDVPTNGSEVDTGLGNQVRGNYCTINPVDASSNVTISNGSLQIIRNSSVAAFAMARGTIRIPNSGKWYWETLYESGSNDGIFVGVATRQMNLDLSTNEYVWGYNTSGRLFQNNVMTYDAGLTASAGDIIMCAYDADNKTLWIGKNGTWGTNGGTPVTPTNPNTGFTGISEDVFPLMGARSSAVGYYNFGQRAFSYTAPTSYKALCTANLPAPLITKPSTVFDTYLWSGNGGTQTISTSFSPDFVWVKQRDNTNVASHVLVDIVRGNNNVLRTNGTDAENAAAIDPALYDGVTNLSTASFDVVKGSSGTYNGTNGSGKSYVGWTWDAGSSTVTNTQGSITSSVRANPSAGFSIVTYTGNGSSGATVGHGLGVSPGLVIVKGRSSSGSDWPVWHSSLTATTGTLWLNLTVAQSTYQNRFDSTGMSSTVFKFGTTIGEQNTNGTTYVAYCFAPVAGYSSISSFVGNGSNDGPFVYTGFRPRFVLMKNASQSADWYLFDALRAANYNPQDKPLFPNGSYAEQGDSRPIDLLSNGFKIRFGAYNWFNGNGDTIIYFAVAESPFQYARAR